MPAGALPCDSAGLIHDLPLDGGLPDRRRRFHLAASLPTTACSQQALQRHDDGDTGNHDAAQADREPERLVFDRLL